MKDRVKTKPKTIFVKMFFLVMMLLTFCAKAQERNISVLEALKISYNNNSKIKQYNERVQQKVNENKAAKGNFLPAINLLGGYTYLSENIAINTSKISSSLDDLGGKYGAAFIAAYGEQIGLSGVSVESAYSKLVSVLGQFPAYPNMEVDKQQFPTAALTLTQPLFTGGKIIAAKKYAKAALNSANIELTQVKNEIAKELIERYLNVVLLKQVVQTREEVYKGMLKHKKQAERSVQLEILPKHVLLRVEVAVANAQKDLKNDLNKEELAIMALRSTMNLPDSIQFMVVDSIAYKDVYLNFESLLSTAYAKQPILGLIGQKEEMSKQALAVEKSKFMPNIAAFGSFNMLRKNLPVVPPKFIVGVQAQINIFNGFKDIHQLRAKKHLKKEVKNAKEYALKQVHLLVESNYVNAKNQQKLYNSLSATVTLSKENLRINTRRFEEGLGKSIDVIDASLLYDTSKIEQLVALNKYYQAISNLYNSVGEPEKIIPFINK